MVGSDAKFYFEIKPSRMAKNASPRLKFNKLLFRSEKTIRGFSENIDY